MYSLVLMTAITSGSAAPDHWLRGGWNCHNACYGGCAGGCWSCSGCHGCGGGCWGGCSGYGYMNVDGVHFCHGTWGGSSSGCHGCFGCYGSYGGYPGYSYYAPLSCHGCYGCYGGYSCYGTPLPYSGPIDLGAPRDKGKIEETPPPIKDKKKVVPDGTSYENRARVIIDVPEDAKVYIDGRLMKTASARRTFQTPDLIAGQTYFYDLKVEIVREGKTLTETQRVILRPGQVASASFASMERAGTATARRE